MAKKPIGHCHICGNHGPLSFEHTPPRRAFNDRPVLMHTLEGLSLANKHNLPFPPLQGSNRGMGRSTLCESCNGFTGAAYSFAFAEWTRQAMELLDKSPAGSEILYPFHIQPLNVLKQIATMALAASDFAPGFQWHLRRFVLRKFERFVPRDYGFFIYLNPHQNDPQMPPLRMSGTAGILNVEKGGITLVMAEIAFPPMGYCILHQRKYSGEHGKPLCDITHFGDFRLNEVHTVHLRLPLLRPIGPMPLNFAK